MNAYEQNGQKRFDSGSVTVSYFPHIAPNTSSKLSVQQKVSDLCRQPELGPLQWSFDKKFALYVDMQVGAPWPGEAKLEDLPVEMEIDWIRYYEYPDE